MSIIVYFGELAGALSGIIGVIWFLFVRAEDTVKPEIKTAISSWLSNLNPERKLANWPMTFASVFDDIFGKKHFSWRCFRRSCIASFVSLTIMILLWLSMQSHVYDPGEILFCLALGAIVNLIPDYFSLLETRYIIKKISNTSSTIKILGLLAIDIIATVFIFVFPLILFSVFEMVDRGRFSFSYLFSEMAELLVSGFLFEDDDTLFGPFPTFGIWLYTTFFTSVWIWLYVLSGLIVKVGAFSGILIGRMRRILDIENKPLRSMGMVCILFVSLIFLIVPVVKLLL